MENASKALLIAAAVLIVILLVAFGMKIFQSSSDVDVDDISNTLNTATTQGSEGVEDTIFYATTEKKEYDQYNEQIFSTSELCDDTYKFLTTKILNPCRDDGFSAIIRVKGLSDKKIANSNIVTFVGYYLNMDKYGYNICDNWKVTINKRTKIVMFEGVDN